MLALNHKKKSNHCTKANNVEKEANHNFSNLFYEHGLLVALPIQYSTQEKQLPNSLTIISYIKEF
jgi:hypothetical protein